MSAAIPIRKTRDTLAVWAFASLVVFVALLFLSFLQRVSISEPELVESRPMQFVSATNEESDASQSEQETERQIEMPVHEIMDTPKLELDPIAMDLTVSTDQLVRKRFEYENFGSINNMYGVSGFANLADVDERPRPVGRMAAQFPESLILQGIYSGEVSLILEVDEQGYSRVRKVLGSTHPELVALVVETFNNALYTIPRKNGIPTRMIMRVGVTFDADRGRIGSILKEKQQDN